MLLGAVREILGQGTLFDGANLLLGEWASILRVEVFKLDSQFLLAILPPGAFMAMGLFIALKNAIDDKVAAAKPKAVNTEISRVRVNFDEK